MADINSLPAEYRTKSLESLPTDLQALVIKNISKKFGLAQPRKESGYDIKAMQQLLEKQADLYRQEFIDPMTYAVNIPRETKYLPQMRCLELDIETIDGMRFRQHMDVVEGTDVYAELFRQRPELRIYSRNQIRVRKLN